MPQATSPASSQYTMTTDPVCLGLDRRRDLPKGGGDNRATLVESSRTELMMESNGEITLPLNLIIWV
jgi:hypothetical protein